MVVGNITFSLPVEYYLIFLKNFCLNVNHLSHCTITFIPRCNSGISTIIRVARKNMKHMPSWEICWVSCVGSQGLQSSFVSMVESRIYLVMGKVWLIEVIRFFFHPLQEHNWGFLISSSQTIKEKRMAFSWKLFWFWISSFLSFTLRKQSDMDRIPLKTIPTAHSLIHHHHHNNDDIYLIIGRSIILLKR